MGAEPEGRGVSTRSLHRHVQVLAGPHQVMFDLTNRCNLSCLHCYNRSGADDLIRDELTDDEVRDLLSQFIELRPRVFCFCGGEPLLRYDLVVEGTRLLADHDIQVSMVTNGLSFTDQTAAELKDAGMTMVQFSLDGARAETHERMRGRAGSFERVTAAIRSAVKAGLAVSVAFCPTAFNLDEVEAALGLAEELGAGEFRVQPLMLLGRAVANRELLDPGPAQYRDLVRTLRRYELKSNMKIDWGDPVEHLIKLPDDRVQAVPFVDVKSDGSLAASTYLPLVVGSVRRHRLREYWQAGLQYLWLSPLVRKMARMLGGGRTLYRPDSPLPITYCEQHLVTDLIDDRLLDLTDEQADRMLKEHVLRAMSTGTREAGILDGKR